MLITMKTPLRPCQATLPLLELRAQVQGGQLFEIFCMYRELTFNLLSWGCCAMFIPPPRIRRREMQSEYALRSGPTAA